MKRLWKFVRMHFRQIIYILVILLPPVLTGNIYNAIDRQLTTTNTLSGLSTLSNVLYLNIEQNQKNFNYTLKLLTSSQEFETLDAIGISRLVGEFTFNNETIKNVYVIDKDSNLIYGVNNNDLVHIDYNSHITSALNGIPSYYSTFINKEPFLQITVPIFANDLQPTVIGVVVITYDILKVSQFLSTISTNTPFVSGYIVDINGRIISKSSDHAELEIGDTIDINKIKLSLDYNPLNTFNIYSDTDLNGVYYPLESTGWTLLVTVPHYKGIQFADIISWIIGLLGAGGVSTTEALRKRSEIANTLDEISNINSNLPQ